MFTIRGREFEKAFANGDVGVDNGQVVLGGSVAQIWAHLGG